MRICAIYWGIWCTGRRICAGSTAGFGTGRRGDLVETNFGKMDWAAAREEYRKKIDAYRLEDGTTVAMKGLRDMNGYLTKRELWHKKGVEFTEER